MAPVAVIDTMLKQLDDEELNKVVSYIGFLVSERKKDPVSAPSQRVGVAQDVELYASDFDLIHGLDDEVAELFGVS